MDYQGKILIVSPYESFDLGTPYMHLDDTAMRHLGRGLVFICI